MIGVYGTLFVEEKVSSVRVEHLTRGTYLQTFTIVCPQSPTVPVILLLLRLCPFRSLFHGRTGRQRDGRCDTLFRPLSVGLARRHFTLVRRCSQRDFVCIHRFRSCLGDGCFSGTCRRGLRSSRARPRPQIRMPVLVPQ